MEPAEANERGRGHGSGVFQEPSVLWGSHDPSLAHQRPHRACPSSLIVVRRISRGQTKRSTLNTFQALFISLFWFTRPNNYYIYHSIFTFLICMTLWDAFVIKVLSFYCFGRPVKCWQPSQRLLWEHEMIGLSTESFAFSTSNYKHTRTIYIYTS